MLLNYEIMQQSNNNLKFTIIAIAAIVGGIVLGLFLHKKSKNNKDSNHNDGVPNTGSVNISNRNKEKFDNNCPCSDPTPYAEYKTIISASAGVSYPIEFSPSTDNEKYYYVKYYNQQSGTYAYLTVVAASVDGNSPVLSLSDGGPILSVGAKNISNNDSQIWKIFKVSSNTPASSSLSSTGTPGTTAAGTPGTTAAATTTTTTSAATTTTAASNLSADKYYFISKAYPGYALQYEDGYLSIRAQGTYENQYWILSKYTYDIGVDTLPNEYVNAPPLARNVSAARGNSGDINSVNQQKLENVLQLITSSLQKLNTANNNNSSSAFGYSVDNPIKINLSMGGGVSASNTEAFTDATPANTSNSTNTANDITSLLDKYENSNSNNSNSVDALTELIAKNGGCQALDMSKYTSKRVGQCNCNLSK